MALAAICENVDLGALVTAELGSQHWPSSPFAHRGGRNGTVSEASLCLKLATVTNSVASLSKMGGASIKTALRVFRRI